MKNRKRLLTLALLCMAVAFSVLGLTACGNEGDNRDPQIVAVYNAYVANANEKGSTPLSYEEWLKSIKGEKGDKGDPGKSAYEIWLDNGFTGTEQDFLNWLKNQSNNADSLGLSFALTDEDTYSVSVGLATERSVIVIPATYNNKPVTKIANKAFNECKNLKKVTIPDSVTSIGNSAFNSCSSLTSVTIGNGVTSIGGVAFSGCTSLTSITIGNSVTSIGNSAFSGCTSLTSATIGNSVTSIGEYAFRSCTSLTSVTIPDSVTSIGNFAFEGCTSLNAVYITDIAAWCNIKFNNNSFRTYNLYLNGELVTKLVIPDSVTSIGEYAFAGCSSLTSITIGNSVTSIGNYAFSGCSSLTSITIGNGVTSIGDWAFYNCYNIQTVFYKGGKEQWDKIGYAGGINVNKLYFYSEAAPTNSGKYWHYAADGVTPVIW